jgi:hypothetical protein
MYNLGAGQRHDPRRDTEERKEKTDKDTMEDDGEKKDKPKKHQKM